MVEGMPCVRSGSGWEGFRLWKGCWITGESAEDAIAWEGSVSSRIAEVSVSFFRLGFVEDGSCSKVYAEPMSFICSSMFLNLSSSFEVSIGAAAARLDPGTVPVDLGDSGPRP